MRNIIDPEVNDDLSDNEEHDQEVGNIPGTSTSRMNALDSTPNDIEFAR